MQNEFEKKVQQQMEQFEIVPGEAVWLKVEQLVSKERRKRRAFYYWISTAVIIFSAAFYLLLMPFNTKKEVALTEPGLNQKDKAFEKSVAKTNNEGITKNNSENKIVNEQKAKDVEEVKEEQTEHRFFDHRKSYQKAYRLNADQNSIAVLEESKKSAVKNPLVSIESDEAKKVLIKKDQIQIEPVDSSRMNNLTKIEETKSNKHKDTSLVADIPKSALSKVVETPKRKIQWGLTLLTGISNNIDALVGLPSSKSLSARYAASPSTSVANSYIAPVDRYKSAFSFGIGVFAQKKISNNMSLSAGLNYQTYAANVAVGQRIDSSRIVADSLLEKSASISKFYKPGQSDLYTNRYNLIELPIDLQWKLNRNDQKPLQLSAGIKPGLIIGSKALYYNPQKAIYYREKEQFKNLQVSMQTALQFTAISTGDYQLQIGPSFQYNITNLTKATVLTKEHLMFLGLKTSVVIKNKTSSK